MKAARYIVLGVALAAGLGAAYLMAGTKPPEPPRVVALPPPPPVTEGVLVAAQDLGIGTRINDADMRWKNWPKDQVPAGAIRQSLQPSAMASIKGSIVRSNFSADEPLRTDHMSPPGSGFLSAILPSGSRAVAIDVPDLGKIAGGFILPNDHVDVIRIFHPDDAPAALASDTILTNVRVLAVGQAVQEKGAEHTVTGSTATLELNPIQVEKVTLAQRTGQLTLSLRSVVDSDKNETVKLPDPAQTMTVIRFGTATETRIK